MCALDSPSHTTNWCLVYFHLSSPVVVALHLVVEHLALLRGGVGDQLGFDDLEDVVADVCQLRLDLGLVVADQGQLVALCTGEISEYNTCNTPSKPSQQKGRATCRLSSEGRRKVPWGGLALPGWFEQCKAQLAPTSAALHRAPVCVPGCAVQKHTSSCVIGGSQVRS